MNFNYFANEMEAMKYYDKSEDNTLSQNLLTKKYDMINNKNNQFIASEKWDGNWFCFIKGEDNQIKIRSRNQNVKGEYEDYSPKVPHLVEELNKLPNNTVLLGEICWAEHGSSSNEVGTILRCKAEKAIERQKNKKLKVKLFDLLFLNNENFIDELYQERINKLFLFNDFLKDNFLYFSLTNFYIDVDSFTPIADKIIDDGGEGLVIQRKDNKYESGKRTAWHSLKLKQKMPEIEVPVVDLKSATKEYTGIELENWIFWENSTTKTKIDHQPTNEEKLISDAKWKPITKLYYKNWCGAIVVNYNGTLINISSGLSDEDREWLNSEEAKDNIKKHTLIAVIKGMKESTNQNNKNISIRHPILIRLRNADDLGENN